MRIVKLALVKSSEVNKERKKERKKEGKKERQKERGRNRMTLQHLQWF